MKKTLLIFLATLTTSFGAWAGITIGIGPGGISIGHSPNDREPHRPNFPGRPDRRSQICFYRDINFRGNSFCVRAGQQNADLRRTGWNDVISSIEIRGDASVDLYQNINFQGFHLSVKNSVADLRMAGFIWNDLASSYRTHRDGGH